MKPITLQSLKWEVLGRLREEALFLSSPGMWGTAKRMLAEGKTSADLLKAGVCIEGSAACDCRKCDGDCECPCHAVDRAETRAIHSGGVVTGVAVKLDNTRISMLVGKILTGLDDEIGQRLLKDLVVEQIPGRAELLVALRCVAVLIGPHPTSQSAVVLPQLEMAALLLLESGILERELEAHADRLEKGRH